MSDQVDPVARRMTGEVVRDGAEFGFLSSEELPGQDIYYKNAWLQGGGHRLQQGERVTFELVVYGDKQQAHALRRVQELPTRDRSALVQYLFDWAYVGYVPNCLSELQGLALPGERWEFRNTPPDPARPSPILYSYLVQTFARLVLETKVRLTADHSFAAFNTGLVDRRYEPIHALFVPNDGRAPWQLAGFCIAGEGVHGQNLVRSFAPLPASAHYFTDPKELLYNVAAGPPSLDWAHIILDRIDRYPREFIEDNRPKDFDCKDPAGLADDERVEYYAALRSAIVADDRTYRRIMNRLSDAVDLSIKRVAWNFKTAIPTYYPRVRRLQLLLPLCLVSDEHVDLALAVEKTSSGSYLGHTVLSLDWAYKNARLVCRPDSDWLTPDEIDAGVVVREDEE